MRKKIIIMSISAIAAILFWAATIMYGTNVWFHTESYGTQLLIGVLLTTASYAATIISSIFLVLIIHDMKEI